MNKRIPIVCDAHIIEIWFEEAENNEQALLQAAKKVVDNCGGEGFKIGDAQDLTTPNPWIEVWNTNGDGRMHPIWTCEARLTVAVSAED